MTGDAGARGFADKIALPFWVVATAVLAADLLTKAAVRARIGIGDPPIPVIGEWIRLHHLRNTGGLFGVLPGNAVYFAVVSAVAVGVILFLVYRTHYRGGPARIALGLILGGALGNLHDRIRYESVVDFVDIGFGTVAGLRWPTFNIADAAVTVGVASLAWWLLRGDPLFRASEASADDDDEPIRARPETMDGGPRT